MVQAGVAARDQRRGNQRHAAANHVHRNHVETLALVRRQLAEVRAKQIGERAGGVDAFIPAGEGRTLRAFDDGGPHDGNREIVAVAHEDGFTQALGKGIRVGPAEVLRAAQAHAQQAIARPAHAIALQHAFQLGGWHGRRIAGPPESLAPQRASQLRAFRPCFDVVNHLAE